MDKIGQGNCGWSCSFCLSQDTCLWVSLDDCGMRSINLAFGLTMELKIGLCKVIVRIMGTRQHKTPFKLDGKQSEQPQRACKYNVYNTELGT